MKFRLLGGMHRQGSKMFKEGDVITSDKNLVKLFRNKFEKIMEDEIPMGVKNIKAPIPLRKDLKESCPPPSEAKVVQDKVEEIGENVTAMFPSAKHNGFLVFKNDKRYTVVSAEDNSTLQEGLRKREVIEYLTQQA